MFALRGFGVKAVHRGPSLRPPLPPTYRLDVFYRQLSAPALFKKNTDLEKQDGAAGERGEKPKIAKPERKTSLRRVGIEAERSRIVVRHKGGVRILERGVETKVRFPSLQCV
jgi:hypothetical protein